MTGKRIALIGLAVAVAVGVIALVLKVTASTASDGGAPGRVAEATGKTNLVDEQVPLTRFGSHASAGGDGRDAGAGEIDAGAGRTIEYVKDDGTVVRDHRAETAPPRPRPVSRPTLLKMRNDLVPLIKECGKALRQRDRTARGKMQADMTVSIRDGRIRIDALDLQVQGLTDSEYPDCVRKTLEGLELFAADGQDDVEKHTMSFPFKVP